MTSKSATCLPCSLRSCLLILASKGFVCFICVQAARFADFDAARNGFVNLGNNLGHGHVSRVFSVLCLGKPSENLPTAKSVDWVWGSSFAYFWLVSIRCGIRWTLTCLHDPKSRFNGLGTPCDQIVVVLCKGKCKVCRDLLVLAPESKHA